MNAIMTLIRTSWNQNEKSTKSMKARRYHIPQQEVQKERLMNALT